MKIILQLVFFIAFVISFLPVKAIQDTVTFSKRISSQYDDVEESEDGSFIYLNSSDLELVFDNYNNQGNQVVGLRFTGIVIPAGAEIINAYVQFTVDAVSIQPTNLIIAGELSNNSPSFSTAPFNVSSRQPTIAQALWQNIPVWPTVGVFEPDQCTPDLSDIISEIINLQGWSSGNPITLTIKGTGTREAVAFDGSPQNAPKLVIEYSTDVPSNDLSLANIISPAAVMYPTPVSSIQVCIKNIGSSPQSNFEVYYSLNQEYPVNETVAGTTLNQGDSLIYNFITPADLSVNGEYSLEAGVILSGDENNMNDLFQKSVLVEKTSVENIHWGSTDNTLNGLTVSWKSPGNSDSLAWGYTDQYLNGKFKALMHSGYAENFYDFTFPPVFPSAGIHYSMYNSSTHDWTNDKVFYTSVDTTQDHFAFTVAGDSRTYLQDWKHVADAMPHNDFTMFLGDMVEDGSLGYLWDGWMNFGQNHLQNNLMFYQYGNHDIGNNNYENIFVLPQNPSGTEVYYSFTFGNALFISLNSEDAGDETQYNWLINTLESHQNMVWKFVFIHQPFYSCGGHENEMNDYFATWWKAFDDFGVDVIFTGHAHNYQRTKPINRNVSITEPVDEYGSLPGQGRCQIISGGAGAPLYPVYPNQWFANAQAILNYGTVEIDGNVMSFKAYNVYHQVIDELTINKNYHTFEIPAGWSGFSTFQNVINPNVVDMFDPVAANLIIMSDFEHVYWPGANTNTYADWDIKSGAKIKLSGDATLNIHGSPTNDRQINLNTNWQFLPVLSPCNVSLEDLFASSLDKLKIVKEIGGTGVYWPEFNISTLSVFAPGKAYLLKMIDQATIEFPECSPAPATTSTKPKVSIVENFWNTPACSGTSHLIAVPTLAAQGTLSEGDITGVFAPEGYCAGQTIYEGKNMAIVAFADDPATNQLDGFADGDSLKFKIFRPSVFQIYDLKAVFNSHISDETLFRSDGISVVSKFTLGTSTEAIDSSDRHFIYPNPAKGLIHITGLAQGAKLDIIPVTGADGYKDLSAMNGTVDLNYLKRGVYIVRITDKTYVTHRIIIVE